MVVYRTILPDLALRATRNSARTLGKVHSSCTKEDVKKIHRAKSTLGTDLHLAGTL